MLLLHHKEIPPTIHYTEPNPQIDFASTPFYVADKLQDWTPIEGAPRRAGVSSFGIGGTNVHVVVQQPADRDYYEAMAENLRRQGSTSQL